MKRLSIRGFLAGTLCVLSISGALAQGAAAVAQPKEYLPGELTPDRYTVIKRLWVESWRSAFWIPTYDDRQAAIAALYAEAGRLGADGIVHLSCFQDRGAWSGRDSFFCYGNAVKLK